METGIVFGVQHFSVRDGPGIRSNVFLKGCPLRCLWCHNPEGLTPGVGLQHFERDCVGCGACGHVYRDMAAANRLSEKEKERLAAVCPHGALKLVGERMGTREVLDDVLKDRRYFASSGGGLTISGGEPLMQPDFAAELAQMAQAEGVSVAVETSLYAPWEVVERLSEHVNVWLVDYKATDDATHQRLVGVSQARIRENLERLYQSGARIILRCPLIPGVNDDEGHLRGIAEMSKAYPDLEGIEVMPYHKMGVSKARRIGYSQEEYDVPESALKECWQAAIEGFGGRVTKMN